jgi:hypothetical protein
MTPSYPAGNRVSVHAKPAGYHKHAFFAVKAGSQYLNPKVFQIILPLYLSQLLYFFCKAILGQDRFIYKDFVVSKNHRNIEFELPLLTNSGQR